MKLKNVCQLNKNLQSKAASYNWKISQGIYVHTWEKVVVLQSFQIVPISSGQPKKKVLSSFNFLSLRPEKKYFYTQKPNRKAEKDTGREKTENTDSIDKPLPANFFKWFYRIAAVFYHFNWETRNIYEIN